MNRAVITRADGPGANPQREIVRYWTLRRKGSIWPLGARRLAAIPTSEGPTGLLESLAERLRRLPGLLVAHVGVAHGGADILVAEELLDFPKIFPQVVEEDCGRGMPQSMGGDLAYPNRPACPS
jgi:hypothetical protein